MSCLENYIRVSGYRISNHNWVAVKEPLHIPIVVIYQQAMRAWTRGAKSPQEVRSLIVPTTPYSVALVSWRLRWLQLHLPCITPNPIRGTLYNSLQRIPKTLDSNGLYELKVQHTANIAQYVPHMARISLKIPRLQRLI